MNVLKVEQHTTPEKTKVLIFRIHLCVRDYSNLTEQPLTPRWIAAGRQLLRQNNFNPDDFELVHLYTGDKYFYRGPIEEMVFSFVEIL